MPDKEWSPPNDLPPGVSATMAEDGSIRIEMKLGKSVTAKHLEQRLGVPLQWLTDKKRKAIAWVPIDDPDHIARTGELTTLLAQVTAHTKSGAIAEHASRDVTGLIRWFTNELARFHKESCETQLWMLRDAAVSEAAPRVKGAARKHANDPLQAAKAEAVRLWPEAQRKGWTAERLWTALRDNGHKVKSDTVRKWLTKLRSTGTC